MQHGANPAVLDPRRPAEPPRRGRRRLAPTSTRTRAFARMIEALARAQGIDLDTPFDELEGRHRRTILHGTGDDLVHRSRPATASPGSRFSTRGCSRRSRRRRGSRSSTAPSSRGWSTTSPARPAWGRGSATTPRPSGSATSPSTRSASGRSARRYAFFKGLKLERRRAAHRRRPGPRDPRPPEVPGRRRARLPDRWRAARRRSPAARASASAWPARSAAA